MTHDQENTVTMFETTIAFLDSHDGLWNSKPAFAATVTEARNGVAAIRSAAASQESPLSGITDEKAQVRGDLEDLTLEIADQVAALAAKNSDPALSAQVHLTRSFLDQNQDDQLVQTAERVRDVAHANVELLGDYGIKDGEIQAFNNAITRFTELKTAPRTAKAARSGMTLGVANLIRATRSLFRNQLDKLMTPFRKSHPDFYKGYVAARVIVNRAASHAPKSSAEPPGANPSGASPSPAPSPAPPK
jgi:hypothetical protein